LRTILADLQPVGVWAFPIHFRIKPDGRVDKNPLAKWKELQVRPPTPEELHAWYKEFADASVGIPTGPNPGTGLLVVDPDSIDAIEYCEKRGMPETWLVRTPFKLGLHYYFRYPDFMVRNSASQLLPGLDIRGLGGFVAAPGSQYRLATGELLTYRWEKGHNPHDLPLAEAPRWLLNELRARLEAEQRATAPIAPSDYRGRMGAWARRAFEQNLQKLTATPPGQRNQALFDVARRFGQLAAGGEVDADTVLEPLYVIAEAWSNTGHSKSTISRAFAMGKANLDRHLARNSRGHRRVAQRFPV
jgi:hypothetical protein